MKPIEGMPCNIADLRWHCTLARRRETADPMSPGMLENYTKIIDVWCCIRPKESIEILNTEVITTPVSHEIIFRWLPFEATGYFDTIIRFHQLPGGDNRQEIFRIRKAQEFEGRQRFIIADAELESFQ